MRKTFMPSFLRSWLAVAATLAAAGASADDFTGAAAPGNFSIANIGTLTGGAPSFGVAVFSTTQLLLRGSNTTSPAPASQAPGCAGGIYSVLGSACQLQVTLNQPGRYSFDWSYVTADPDGPGGDIFGVIVDGSRIALSNLGGAVGQLGTASFLASSSFGWFVNCTDCIGGLASATVSSFTLSPVPEPHGAALLLGGALGLVAWRRRRTAGPAAV